MVGSYCDFGVSAFRAKNRTQGALGRFLRDVESGKVQRNSWLLIEALDRLSRERLEVALPWFVSLLRSGIKIATVLDDHIYDAASTENLEHLRASLLSMAGAHEESRTKALRVRQSWQRRRARGSKGLICPSWLYLDPGTSSYKAHKDRVQLIKEMFNWAIEGHSARAIARLLNARDEPTFDNVVSRRGKRWHATTVYNILNNRAVLGFSQPAEVIDGQRQPFGDEIPHFYPAVIDVHVWLEARARRRTQAHPGPRTSYVNLFSIRAHCARCHGLMKIRTSAVAKGRSDFGRVFRYLVCANADQRKGCTIREEYNYDEVEKTILDYISSARLSAVATRPLPPQGTRQVDDELAAVEHEVSELERRRMITRNRLSKMEDSHPLFDETERTLIAILADISRYEGQRQRLVDLLNLLGSQSGSCDQVQEQIRQLRLDLNTAEGEQRREIRSNLAVTLQTVIEEVRFNVQAGHLDLVIRDEAKAVRFRKSDPQGRGRKRTIEPTDL